MRFRSKQHRFVSCLLTLVLTACIGEQPLSPTEQPTAVGTKPLLNHAPKVVEVDANNYVMQLQAGFLSGSYKGIPALFAGGLAYGNAGDAAFFYNPTGQKSPRAFGELTQVVAGSSADHQTVSLLLEETADNLGPSNAIGLAIVRETYAFNSAPDDDYVMIKYSLTNTTNATISNLHVGEVLDVDLANAGQNFVEYVAADMAARTTVSGSPVAHGHILLSHAVTSYRGFCNLLSDPCPGSDPTTLAGWFAFLSGGIVDPAPYVSPLDIREFVTSGPASIPAGASLVLFTALVGGDDLVDLTANIAAARAKYASMPATSKDPALTVQVDVALAKIREKKDDFEATFSFADHEQALLFDDTRTVCGGAPATQVALKGKVVTASFPKSGIDLRIREGEEMVCGGVLHDGSVFADRVTSRFKNQIISPVTQLTAIGRNFGPTWSPDGSEIAFVSDRVGGNTNAVFRMNLADGDATATQVTVATGGFPSQRAPNWSPDGSVIAFYKGGALHTIANTGGVETPITNSEFSQDPQWSPDGTQIAFRRGPNIWLIEDEGEIVGSPAVPLAINSSGFAPFWGADGLVYFFANRGNGFRIYSIDPLDPEPGTPAVQVTPTEATDDRYAAISPNGQTLAFISRSSAGREIILQDLATGEHTVVLLDSPINFIFNDTRRQNLEFSPDGTHLLCVGIGASGVDQIYLVDLAGLL